MADKPAHHKVPVVKIKEVNVHPNADMLEIIPIEGFQAVVRKGDFKPGDLAYYIYPDSVVPVREEFAFLWKDKTIPGEEPPIKYRRISAKKLRKEWSEGLLMPLSGITGGLVHNEKMSYGWIKEGDDISDALGVTHYEPPEPADLGGANERGPKRPRSLKGWLYFVYWKFLGLFGVWTPLASSNEKGPKFDKPYYDVENLKNYKDLFNPGEDVLVTEKIHGCQGKYIYQDGHMYAGSRNNWKSKTSKCVWRKCLDQNPWIEEWCKSNQGYTLYGEVFPVQGEKFMYGCKPGEIKFRVFDILGPNEVWQSARFTDVGHNCVPELWSGPFDMDKMKELASGKSVLDNKTIREGIVIKPRIERHVRGLGRLKLKLINNEYLEKGN